MSATQKISVGVIARNEEAGIAAALESFLKQSIFRSAKVLECETELIVLAGGCTDRTVEVTEEFFKKAHREFPEGSPVRLRIETVPEAGFANVLNQLTHTYSRPDADFIYFVNAGIVLDQDDVFELMLRSLQKDYGIKVVLPVGRKLIEASKCKSLVDRLDLAATRFTKRNRTWPVCGRCFCARAAALRTVWMPKYFPGAVDSCFKRMIICDMAAVPDNPARLGTAQASGYTFEASRTFRDIYSGRVRLFIGQTFIETLMQHLKTMRTEQPKLNLTSYLRVRDETDSSWLHRLVQLNIHVNGLFATMPSPWLRLRFWRNPEINMFKKLVMLPVAVIAVIFDVPVFLTAAWRLKTGRVADVWKDTGSWELWAEQ